ncbi:subtilisin-like protein [Hyaloscypha variabilis F]|uniref:tripeptidyl-peptidase II n=1 Tax=Hyaloscypha variabilis (strain UAMH 11265 / GT02V1 / F) TaxID=1149755 RepID=A0A2J6RTU9_HYAVF|nr:subtilisin-like protein [Hyaloscypha variabilis F]
MRLQLTSPVSDPSHERYGQHLSIHEVTDLVKPSDESLDLVHSWLEDNGIPTSHCEYSPAKDWIKISLPINAIENLLDTQYSVFEHSEGGYLVRAPEWSVPKHLHEHITAIQPTTSFFSPQKLGRTFKKVLDISADTPPPSTNNPPRNTDPAIIAACNATLVTPLCLRTLYGTVNYTVQSASKNSIALNDFLGESNNRSDTKLFLQRYRPDAVSGADKFSVQLIANGNNEQTQENATELAAGKDMEGNLDSETIISLSYPTPLIAYSTGGSPPFTPDLLTPTNTNEPYLEWLNYVLNQTSLPQVISTSYADDEQSVPLSYALSVCAGFAQLGARGVSLFFGSGDAGVGQDGACVSNDGKNVSTFLAMFPTSCPYITSVGATKFIPEIVATDASNGFVSGGGFSRYFARPSYQDAIVTPYIKALGTQFSGLYNASGRAYPDLSAQGYHYSTIWNGSLMPLDGTSASTPTVASIFSLVNDDLIAKGKPPMGFLNPWLYSVGYKGFMDVVNGSAIGCGTTGFPAKEGWDAVSGFGTPWFPSIRELAANASAAVVAR